MGRKRESTSIPEDEFQVTTMKKYGTAGVRNRPGTVQEIYTFVHSLPFDGSYAEDVMVFVSEKSWLCLKVKCIRMHMYFINQTFVQFH